MNLSLVRVQVMAEVLAGIIDQVEAAAEAAAAEEEEEELQDQQLEG